VVNVDPLYVGPHKRAQGVLFDYRIDFVLAPLDEVLWQVHVKWLGPRL
jgi:hypothetical protein